MPENDIEIDIENDVELENNIAKNLHLNDVPNWVYLMREFYEVYRYLPSGGSNLIRSHQKQVREAISRVMLANSRLRFEPPEEKPVTAHFQRALDEGRTERQVNMIRAIDTIKDKLVWRYGYDKIPKGLKNTYAYAELCGPTGPVISDEVILGLVLFAPKCTYPTHSHDGITESYICLSGAVSENHQGVYAPGSLIFNPPGQLHRITVADYEPALMAYAWAGPKEKLHGQKMNFSRK